MLPHRRVNVPDYEEAFAVLQEQIVALTIAINNMHVEHAPTTHDDFPSDEENVPEDNPFAPLQPAHPRHVSPPEVPRPNRVVDDTY